MDWLLASVGLCDDGAMPHRVHVVALPSELGEFADEVRRVFLELGRSFSAESLAGECSPSLDVYETDEAVEVSVDLPGVDAATVRILAKGQSLLVAGEKPPRRTRGESTFHLVERGYGRFARVVRLVRACDTSRAQARLAGGELRITIPKIEERRGRAIPIVSLDSACASSSSVTSSAVRDAISCAGALPRSSSTTAPIS
jgi:HSP20 family protein